MEPARSFSRSTLARLFQPILEELIASGTISVEGKTDEEIGREFALWAHANAGKEQTFLLKLDHRQKLLKLARGARKEQDLDLASLHYATFMEHTLNNIIDLAATRKGLPHSSIINIIREVSLRGKTTWLLEMLGIRPIPEKHKDRILQVSDFRNCFVHYKWKGVDADKTDQTDPQVKLLFEQIENTITYLYRYENSNFYSSSKKRVRKILLGESGGKPRSGEGDQQD